MSNGPIEPSAELRVLASTLRQMYLALVAEGFTTTEAMTIIAETIRASLGGKS
jgi:hypothetical protein